jgi:hypothetical protein
VTLTALTVASATDTPWGSTLTGAANVVKNAEADSVYWASAFADGSSATAPSAGQVKSVTVKGHWVAGAYPKVFIQVLRPQPDGSVQVVATSQPFTMPSVDGTYTFEPENMFVQQGDYLGLATLGGEIAIASAVSGSTTLDFTGHNQDMNGSIIRPTATESNTELLLRVDLVPTPPSTTPTTTTRTPPTTQEKPKKPKKVKKGKKKCHCEKMKVKLDPTLLNKTHLRPDQHAFGVGFTWRMTCSKGNGGCKGTVVFSPPKILAGALPAPPPGGLHLNLKQLTFACKSACRTSTQGRFEIKMLSREQLNKLFGRTLAYTVRLICPGGKGGTVMVKVLVDQHGVLRAHP